MNKFEEWFTKTCDCSDNIDEDFIIKSGTHTAQFEEWICHAGTYGGKCEEPCVVITFAQPHPLANTQGVLLCHLCTWNHGSQELLFCATPTQTTDDPTVRVLRNIEIVGLPDGYACFIPLPVLRWCYKVLYV